MKTFGDLRPGELVWRWEPFGYRLSQVMVDMSYAYEGSDGRQRQRIKLDGDYRIHPRVTASMHDCANGIYWTSWEEAKEWLEGYIRRLERTLTRSNWLEWTEAIWRVCVELDSYEDNK